MSEHVPAFSPEDLFEHAAFLRQLARGLLRDEHLAEDVAQEAMVAALEHPPRERGALRAWLAQAARNLALNRRTSAARRQQREEHAARPERLDPDEEANERLELERTVFDRVLELDEAKRTALFLRYHEGLEPAAIAERLGVPLKTVKTRLARGLAELRERLERKYGGDRRALGLALTVLARAPALGTTTAIIGGGLAMKLGLATAFGLVFLFVWQGTRERHAEERREIGRIGDQVLYADGQGNLVQDPEAQTAAARESLGSTPAAAAAVETWELTGTVHLREDGSALAGVEVVAALTPGSELLNTTTDAAGRYRFEGRGSGTLAFVRANATPTTTADERSLGLRFVAGQPRVVELWVTRGAALAGTVVDVDGRPVAGAHVRAWSRSEFEPLRAEDRHAKSAADGSFVVEHLGESFVLSAEKPGLACQYGLRGKLAAGANARGLEVVMTAAATLRGHVVDANERPIAGAQLFLAAHQEASDSDGTSVPGVQRFRALDLHARTDAQGAFALGPVPPGLLGARITQPEFLPLDAQLDSALADNRIQLDAGFRLRGRVLGQDGRPLARASLAVASFERRTLTDADGLFEVSALAATEQGFVLVVADDHAVFVRQPVRIGPDGETFVELRLERALPLAGRVLDAQGRPVVDVLVRAEGDRLVDRETAVFGDRVTWEAAADRNETHTDAEGRFRLTQLYDGDFELRVSAAEAPELATRVRTRSGREDLEITLDRATLERVVFAGRVLAGRTGRPVPQFTVVPMHATERVMGGINKVFGPEAGGEFRVVGNEPGTYELRVSATGYAGWNEELREYREGETRFEVVLWPMCAVSFVARDTDGRPLSLPAQLVFHDLDGRWLSVDHGTWTSNQATVNQAPTLVAGLPMQVVRVSATAPGFSEQELELDLTVPPTEPVVIVFERDAASVRARCQIAVLTTAEAALTDRLDPALLEPAFVAGRLHEPASAVDLDFLDQDGRLVARARLEPSGDGAFDWSCTLDGMEESSQESGSMLAPELPARVTQVLVRCARHAERRVPLDLSRAEREPVLVVLLED